MLQVYNSNTNGIINNFDKSVFIDVLKKKWDDLHQQAGIFRYQINALKERIVDNRYLLQLNPNRGTKRRMPENINHISQPFDEEKFNFTKVSDKEIMFTVTENNDESNKHIILVNVSPVNSYHSLLCPSMYKHLPQVVTLDSLKLALKVMLYAEDRSLKIGFNSLCALASVNHLHYHLMFENHTLPVQVAKYKQIRGPLHVLEDYIVPTFLFFLHQDITKTAQDVFKLIQVLLQKCIAHNILITWGKGITNDVARVCIWPRKSCAGVKKLAAFNVALCELAGWFPIYDASQFETLRCEDLEDGLRKWKYDEFNELCDEVQSLY